MFNRKTGHAYSPPGKEDFRKRCVNRFIVMKDKYPDVIFPLEGPCVLVWFFLLTRPKRLSSKRHELALLPALSRGDTDGYLKVVKDALQKPSFTNYGKIKRRGSGIIVNDNQVFAEHVYKLFVRKDEEPKIVLWLKCWKPETVTPFMDLLT